jgi:hypothetical protein
MHWFSIEGAPDLWQAIRDDEFAEMHRALIQGGSGLLQLETLHTIQCFNWTTATFPLLAQYHGHQILDGFVGMWSSLCSLCNVDDPCGEPSVLLSLLRHATFENLQRVTRFHSLQDDPLLWKMALLQCVQRSDDNWELFEFIAKRSADRCPLPCIVLETACGLGRVNIIKGYLSLVHYNLHGYDATGCTCATLQYCSAGRAIEVLQLLHSANIPLHPDAIFVAIDVQPPYVVQWIMEHSPMVQVSRHIDVFLRAVMSSRVDVIQILCMFRWTQGVDKCDPIFCILAAERGDTSMLQWLRSCDFSWDFRVIWMSLLHEHFCTAQWALLNDCPIHGGMEARSTDHMVRMALLSLLRRIGHV